MSEIYSAINVKNLSVLVFVSHQICAFRLLIRPFRWDRRQSLLIKLIYEKEKIFLLTHVKYKNLLLYLI